MTLFDDVTSREDVRAVLLDVQLGGVTAEPCCDTLLLRSGDTILPSCL